MSVRHSVIFSMVDRLLSRPESTLRPRVELSSQLATEMLRDNEYLKRTRPSNNDFIVFCSC